MYGRNQYKQARATTATPGELVVMLYDGILRFCEQAAACMESKDTAGSGVAINRAIAIVDYLQTILDPNPAPDLAERLDALYAFWTRHLSMANAKQDAAMVRQIRPAIAELRDAWEQATQQVRRDELGQQLLK